MLRNPPALRVREHLCSDRDSKDSRHCKYLAARLAGTAHPMNGLVGGVSPVKVVTIVGARPQFIKAAAVSLALERTAQAKEVLVHTGQHYDDSMCGLFFRQLGMKPPSYDLGVGSGSHAVQTARMLEALEPVLEKEKPRWVLVYGDTNSTLAGALAAAKMGIRVVHVESGVRCYDKRVPEEINRVVVDHLATVLCAPTHNAVKCLMREGISGSDVLLTGDVMLDACLHYGETARKTSTVLARLGLTSKSYVLATIHRAENTDDPEKLGTIVEGLRAVSGSYRVVMPLHPRTRKALVNCALLQNVIGSFDVLEPVGYFDMLVLEQHARLVMSDSGGVPKEASFLGTPSLILRTGVEWPELAEAGAAVVAEPASVDAVSQGISDALGLEPVSTQSMFGDGKASCRIAARLCV